MSVINWIVNKTQNFKIITPLTLKVVAMQNMWCHLKGYLCQSHLGWTLQKLLLYQKCGSQHLNCSTLLVSSPLLSFIQKGKRSERKRERLESLSSSVLVSILKKKGCVWFLGKVKAGESVLIHAGASGVGTAAIQLCIQAKAHPYITAGSSAKIQSAVRLGAVEGFNYKEENVGARVLEATGGRIWFCFGLDYEEHLAAGIFRS